MNEVARQSRWLLVSGLLLTGGLVVLALILSRMQMRPPGSEKLPVYGEVSPFSLTNQAGAVVTEADLRGHVWLADIIFTRCAGPCPRMTRQMRQIEESSTNRTTKLVTLTSDPAYDTSPVLTAYAEKFGANTNRWMFLTGTKKQIVDLAVGSLKLTTIEKPESERESPEDLFIHSTMFVLVDKHLRWRAVFETSGEGVDPELTKNQVLHAIELLEAEK